MVDVSPELLNVTVPLLWAKPVVVPGVLVKSRPIVRIPEVEVKPELALTLKSRATPMSPVAVTPVPATVTS